MELIIKGDSKKIKRLAKELKIRCSRNSLDLSVSGQDEQEVNIFDLLNVKETTKLINAISNIEELKQFDSDERKGVISVLEDRRKELEKEE